MNAQRWDLSARAVGMRLLQGVLLVLGGLIAIGVYRFLSCQIHEWIEKAVSDWPTRI
jgi:hypothetical protein